MMGGAGSGRIHWEISEARDTTSREDEAETAGTWID